MANAARAGADAAHLDTSQSVMTVWPIYAFPYATSTQTVDQGQLKLHDQHDPGAAWRRQFPAGAAPHGAGLGEQIVLPPTLQQNNPYTYGVTESVTRRMPARSSWPSRRRRSTIRPGRHQSRPQYPRATPLVPPPTPPTCAGEIATPRSTSSRYRAPKLQARPHRGHRARRLQPIYGFSVFNSGDRRGLHRRDRRHAT